MILKTKPGFDPDFLWGGAISCSQADGGFRDGGKGISTQDLRYLDPAWNHEQVEAKHTRISEPKIFRTSYSADTNVLEQENAWER